MKKPTKELLLTVGVLLIILLTPLIVGLTINNVKNIDSKYLGAWANHYDLYHYGKALVLWCVSLFLLLLVSIGPHSGSQRLDNKFKILLIIILLETAVSSLSSQFQSVVYLGYPGLYFGLFSYLSLFILFFSVSQIDQKGYLVVIERAVIGIATIVSILALINDFYPEYFNLNQFLRNSSELLYGEGLEIRSQSSLMAATFYNANYLGVYCCSLAIFIMVRLSSNEKVNYWLIFSHGLILLTMLFTRSKAALYTYTAVFLLHIIFLTAVKNRHQVYRLIPSFLILITFLFSSNIFQKSKHDAIKETISEIDKVNSRFVSPLAKNLREINLTDKIEIVLGHTTLSIKYMDFTWKIFANEKELFSQNDLDSSVKDFKVLNYFYFSNSKMNGIPICEVKFNRFAKISFVKTLQGFRVYQNNNIFALEQSPNHFLPVRPSFLTNRGYIWNGTLATLNENLLLGHGLDTLPLTFKQHDLVRNIHIFGRADILVDKPHSFFLQILYGNGLLGLAAYLLFLGTWLYKGLRNRDQISNLSHSAFMAVIAWHIMGLTNDATVATAPTAFILMGLMNRSN